MKTRSIYLTLFLSVFRISACTFGGGFVIVPLMRERFVNELGWIDEQEMLDLTAIAQSCPGPIAVNAAIVVGYRVAGIGGALTAIAGTILPPLLIIGTISVFYQAFRENVYAAKCLKGILCGVAAVVLHVVVAMARKLIGNKAVLPVVMMILSFAAVRFLHWNVVAVLLCCGLIGLIGYLMKKKT